MLIKALAFVWLAYAYRDQNEKIRPDPLIDRFDNDQLTVLEENASREYFKTPRAVSSDADCIKKTGNQCDCSQCECKNVTVQDIDLTPINPTVGLGEACRYTLPDLVKKVHIFTYDGKPAFYHQTVAKSYKGAVKYCSGLGMHLPVPNTEQQYEELKTIPRYVSKTGKYKTYHTYWLGFSDAATEGTWLNIYNGEELAIDKWGDGEPNNDRTGEHQIEMYQYDDSHWKDTNEKYRRDRSTLCMRTNLETELDYCGLNFDDCSSEAICTNSGTGWNCTCPNAKIGDLVIEPASSSTGKGSDPCHYFHPNFDGHRVFTVNYGGRDTVAYIGPAAGSTFYHYAKKCQSLGMRMFTPENLKEAELLSQLRNKRGNMRVPLGVTRRSDGHWRNIYTGDKAWTYFRRNENDSYGSRDFAFATNQLSYPHWYAVNFESLTSYARTVCIALKDGESTEIDFCATGFNDCRENSFCSNDDENGYTCKCQAKKFDDVSVASIDIAETGRNCTSESKIPTTTTPVTIVTTTAPYVPPSESKIVANP